MTIVLSRPQAVALDQVVAALREWQIEGGSVHLHPGDVGWYLRFGAEATAAALRTWSRDGRILAVGLIDGPELVRLAVAPEAQADDELVRQLVGDVSRPERGVLPEGDVSVEARFGGPFRDLLLAGGRWVAGAPWTPLRRDLADPVEDCGLRIEGIGPDLAHVRAAVQRAAFDRSTFTGERWHAMAAGSPYGDARCLVAYDGRGDAVAAATVWSAGAGRPGLLEPLGVHRDHRRRGHGTAISLAAAAALRSLGSSSAVVCTPSSNIAAVATYASAGFARLADIRDLECVRNVL